MDITERKTHVPVSTWLKDAARLWLLSSGRRALSEWAIQVPPHIRDAVLIGVDLGPNLSVTGSLATVLWLIALRREGEHISGSQFLKTGLLVMPPALFLASLAVSLLSG